METVSVHLPFPDIVNCRDLAGIVTKQGKVIAPGRLIRSASLHHAGKESLMTLQDMGLSDVVDLRTDWERAISPDPHLPDVHAWHFPVLHESTLAAEEGSQIRLAEGAASDASQVFEEAYKEMILSAESISAWQNFFALLVQNPRLVLWHCTQGKDRTGMAAALLLHALDVDEQTIFEDYMQTNLYLSKEAMEERVMATVFLKGHEKLAQDEIEAFSYASPAYYKAAEEAVKANYGSWDGYLRKAIGLRDEDFEILRSNYLQ